jgi:hypothetical protein
VGLGESQGRAATLSLPRPTRQILWTCPIRPVP